MEDPRTAAKVMQTDNKRRMATVPPMPRRRHQLRDQAGRYRAPHAATFAAGRPRADNTSEDRTGSYGLFFCDP
jgi:hypothetical protein